MTNDDISMDSLSDSIESIVHTGEIPKTLLTFTSGISKHKQSLQSPVQNKASRPKSQDKCNRENPSPTKGKKKG